MRRRLRRHCACHFRLAIVLVTVVLAACGGERVTPAVPTSTRAVQPLPATEAATPSATLTSAVAAPSVSETLAPPTTVEEVYARASATLRQQEGIYHATIAIVHDAGEKSYDATVDRWADVSRDVIREESTDSLAQTTTLIVDGGRYTRYPDGTAPPVTAQVCHGAGEAVSAVLGCPGFTETSETSVEQGEYDGRPAVILVTVGEWYGSDSTTTFTSRLYLEADSLLPIVKETEGEIDDGTVREFTTEAVYEHEFVEPESLPADFFDLVSIGYTPVDLEAPLDEVGDELAVYWLGLAFEPGTALPELVLGTAVAADADGASYELTLEYRLASEPFGPSVVTILEWQRAAWESGMGQSVADFWEQMPCHDKQEIGLPNGEATLYMGYEDELRAGEACEDVEFSRYGAIAVLGDTVLTIDAAGVSGPQGYQPSPYNTRAGMDAVLHGLVEHQPRADRPAPTVTPRHRPLPTPAPGEALEPIDVFALLEAALNRQGLVYHASVTQIIVRDGQAEPWWSADVWLDAERHTGRGEYRRDPQTSQPGIDEVTSIYADGLVHFTIPGKGPGPSESPYCYGAPEASLSAFLLCWSVSGGMYELLVAPGSSRWDGNERALERRVEPEVEFEGHAALALVYEVDSELVDEPAVVRLYVERETFLPLAWVNESIDGGRLVRRFEHEFIATDSLPADFFDPATLGARPAAAGA